MELVLVATNQYSDPWWVNNIKHMTGIDNVSVISNEVYGGVYDKLRLFEKFKEDKQYLYLDLDIVITGDIKHLLRKELHVLHAWWREPLHTPLNSSIMSWKGDYSFIHDKFASDPDYYMVKYNKGIDEYLWKEFDPLTYEPVCTSYRYHGFKQKWSIVLFNQSHQIMREGGEWSKYLL